MESLKVLVYGVGIGSFFVAGTIDLCTGGTKAAVLAYLIGTINAFIVFWK